MASLFPAKNRGANLQDTDRSNERVSSDSENELQQFSKKLKEARSNPYDPVKNKATSSENRYKRNALKRTRRDKDNRNRGDEDKVLGRLYGNGPKDYSLYALIEDKDGSNDTKRFSKQPLRVVEALLQGLLEVTWDDINKSNGFKISKFKRGASQHFTSEVQVFSEEHLAKLLKAEKIGDFEVKVQENFRKNCVPGTLKDFRKEFEGESDEDIKAYFHTKGIKDITLAKRLGKSDVILLSFRGQNKPNNIEVGTKSFQIKDYVQKPPRCFKCQEYTHPKQTCKSEVFRCYRCGLSFKDENSHVPKECKADARCVHCRKDHMTGNFKCEVEAKEMKFQKIMAERGISRREALRLYPTGEVASYVDVVATPPVESGRAAFSGSGLKSPYGSPQPEQSIISTILEQNKVILERLQAVAMPQRATSEMEAEGEIPEREDKLNKKVTDLAVKFDQLSQKQLESDKKIENLQRQLVEKDRVIAEKDKEIKRLVAALKDKKADVAARSVIIEAGTAADDLLNCNKELILKNEHLQQLNKELTKGSRPTVPPDKSND